jgi:hypothetical protein
VVAGITFIPGFFRPEVVRPGPGECVEVDRAIRSAVAWCVAVTIKMQRRMLYIPILHIDTNLINARQKPAAVNQLEKWFADGIILINMSGTAHVEAQAGGSASRAAKANQQIFTVTPAADPTDPHFKKIESILYSAWRTRRERAKRCPHRR